MKTLLAHWTWHWMGYMYYLVSKRVPGQCEWRVWKMITRRWNDGSGMIPLESNKRDTDVVLFSFNLEEHYYFVDFTITSVVKYVQKISLRIKTGLELTWLGSETREKLQQPTCAIYKTSKKDLTCLTGRSSGLNIQRCRISSCLKCTSLCTWHSTWQWPWAELETVFAWFSDPNHSQSIRIDLGTSVWQKGSWLGLIWPNVVHWFLNNLRVPCSPFHEFLDFHLFSSRNLLISESLCKTWEDNLHGIAIWSDWNKQLLSKGRATSLKYRHLW